MWNFGINWAYGWLEKTSFDLGQGKTIAYNQLLYFHDIDLFLFVLTGNVLYMDPDILRLHDASRPGYDIYVDTAGYAVPNRIVKRAVGETNEVRSSWDTQCHILGLVNILLCAPTWLIIVQWSSAIKTTHGTDLKQS